MTIIAGLIVLATSMRAHAGPLSAMGDSYSATIAHMTEHYTFEPIAQATTDPVFGTTSSVGEFWLPFVEILIDTNEFPGPGPDETTLTFRITGNDKYISGMSYNNENGIGFTWDIGDFNAGLNLVEFGQPFSIHSAQMELFSDGNPVFSTSMPIDPIGADPRSRAVFSNGGAGLSIRGSVFWPDDLPANMVENKVNETLFTIVVPEPACAALLAIGGLVVVRRRRGA